jgi:flagellum-specific peptidoglycan hydrolase FlgJ
MIEGNNLFNFDFFTRIKENLFSLTSDISRTINNTFNPPKSTSLMAPDLLFLNSAKPKQVNENFSFLDYNSSLLTKNIIGKSKYLAAEKLKTVSPQQLEKLGTNNKPEFFKTLLPAALESERIYGVPASVTLAQAALESGWASASIGGYNIFGIKGSGPAGTINLRTKEWENGRYVTINANFAKYNNFYEAVMKHGEVFLAPYNGYKNGIQDYAAKKDDYRFVDLVSGTYATSPTYKNDIKSIMRDFDLVNMARNSYA